MEERNGVIIDGVVYLTKTNITHKHRCSLRELDCCDGEKMHDTICANICASDEYSEREGNADGLSTN